ncbi:MAG: transcription-repair coupling factor [Phycisphaerales bacterium]|nr:transcription-repair coupling factor [Phycisphaerales bacterium]
MIDTVQMVIPSITSDGTFGRLVRRLRDDGGVLGVSGLWGSSAPMLVAALAAAAADRPFVYVTAHLDEADEALDDLETFGAQRIALLPAWETLPGEGSSSGEIHGERLRLCASLRQPGPSTPRVIVTPAQALLQRVPSPASLDGQTLTILPGGRQAREEVIRWLVDRGFERLDRVESPGDFAWRGEIIDVFAPGRDQPVRLEFLDDQVESVREFDVGTQRSTQRIDGLTLLAMPKSVDWAGEHTTAATAYWPENTVVVIDRPGDVQELAQTVWTRLNRSSRLMEPSDVLRSLSRFTQIHITRVGMAYGAADDVFHFDVRSLTRFEGKTDAAIGELCAAAVDHRVIVYCHNDGERSRLRELVEAQNRGIPTNMEFAIGVVRHGFEWTAARTLVVPHHELFHRTPARRLRRAYASRPLDASLELSTGDYVVHVLHGIARFRGMKTMQKGDSNKRVEFMTLEFADRAQLHVPTTQIDLVHRYIGAAGVRPALSKLGGTRWKTTTDRVSDAVSDLAESLLRVQAARTNHEGIAYPPDTNWQREFEESFAYEDTEDQTTVVREIKGDLTRPRPMDRLLCGDVGYGKTELAIRAAFKVVEYGKQVAVLVPTTVLAEQHYRTFTERLAEYPFSIGCLSRFRSAKEQKTLIEHAKKGQIDILIGTHRLLSADVSFRDLGMVVIDEEQRFGVEHKERFKHVRSTVDVLTLSATPIPRTLHMAMVGLRDISSLQTPPMDRRSIATRVLPFDADTVRSAVLREMNRDGQVYFVHNVVKNIQTVADQIAQLVPEARIIIGHGQMKEGALERVMHAFVNRQADVLVATTIIESGIDIPNVNTIFINQADRFGLADLHQLRGRVGRSAHRGYCYFLLPASRPVTDKAAKRLKAIEEFSDLGAGFRIAMRDLEIRGAGNLLGPEQSGHIAAVGYEMYCQLLERSVRRIRGEPETHAEKVHLELDIPAFIPRSYMASERTRVDIYRRVAACATPSDVQQLENDIRDEFGPYPDAVRTLVDLAEIRTMAARWGIRAINLTRPDVVFTIAALHAAQPVFTDAPGTVRSPDATTVHLRLKPVQLEPPTLLAILRKMLSRPAPGDETSKRPPANFVASLAR